MAHFKLKSIDIAGMFGSEPGTYEYICLKNPKDKTYTRLSGPMGGFDVFNLRCLSKEDYKRADWVIEMLNKKYKGKECKDRDELANDVTNLYGSYIKVQGVIRDIKSRKAQGPCLH